MNSRTLIKPVLFALALGAGVCAQAQSTSGTTIPPSGMAGAPVPLPSTPQNPPLTVTPPVVNPQISTLEGPNVQGQYQMVPGGVSTQGRVGTEIGSCPCSITTPNTRPPVGGCNC